MVENYRISFFKNLVDSEGHPANACQGVIKVSSPSREIAIERARKKFANLKGVSSWSLRADYEVAEVLPTRNRVSRLVRTNRNEDPT
jgi:hypothetical protein